MSSLRVALFATNNDRMYSGGRYHALIVAHALALTGAEVEFVTNEVPRFAPDLAPIAPQRVRYTRSSDFEKNLPRGDFDFVIVVPTGQFLPRFYERAMAFARQAKARIGLINFESANMFNALSPVQRDTRVWDYWRRILYEGGLVISSTRVSDHYARSFYRNLSGAPVRFEVCGPAINSVAAREAHLVDKDGSIVAFVRPSDRHKGAHDLLSLDPLLLSGRTLHIVSGGEPDMEYAAELDQRLGRHAEIMHHTAVSDVTKFRLLTRAKALLFPSRFEGFGYPPVEAAYAGAETVAYDLPVLQETVGPIAHLARLGDVGALNRKLEEALAREERRAELRAHVSPRVDVSEVATRIGDILLRSADTVPRLGGKRARLQWGPFEYEEPDPAHLEIPPVSPSLVSHHRRLAGDSLLSIRFATRAPVTSVRATDTRLTPSDVHLRLLEIVDGWRIAQATMLLPPTTDGTRITLEARTNDESITATIPIELGEPEQLTSAMLQLERVEPARDGGSILTFAYLGSDEVDEAVASTDGAAWTPATPEDRRFTVRLRESQPHLSGVSVFLFRQKRPVAAYSGFPPRRRGRRPLFDPTDSQTISILRIDDETWRSGFLRRPSPPHYGGVACEAAHLPPSLRAGAVLRFPSGRLLRLQQVVSDEAGVAQLLFREPLNAVEDGVGDDIELMRDPGAADFRAGAAGREDIDPSWRDGVWCGEGALHRRGLMLPWAMIEAVQTDPDHPGQLRIGADAFRRIEQVYDCGGYGVVWLDRPWPEDMVSPGSQQSGEQLALDAHSGSGWLNGIAVDGPLRGRAVRLRGGGLVREGQVLKFSRSGLRSVVHVKGDEDHTIAVLQNPIALDRPEEETLRLAWPSEIEAQGNNNLLFANEVRCSYPSPLLSLLDRYRTVRLGESGIPAKGDRKRVLFLTVVPPVPADQGNRIVTHNFIAHLVSQGHDVDVVLLGDVDLPALAPRLGDHVRIFCCPYPDWEKAPSAAARRKVQEELRNLKPGPPERDTMEQLRRAAREFHPYFIIPDAMVRLAAALYRRNIYDSVVCNYTHALRVAKELETIRPLPAMAVVTHDALSRLPTETDGVELDTGCRLCRPEVERDVLNAVPHARILAISRSERGYFAEIGVTNPIVLCEYDGLGEIRGSRAMPASFDSKRLVFQASANPMNLAALNWFVRNCWPAILREVPEAQLVVSGRVSRGWKAPQANIETQGVLSRSEMLEELGGAAIALNPTLAGTGLKIKTVEAACAGVPSVCLPAAVEGLEDVADRFAVTAQGAADFSAACIRLLTDREAWMALHASALAFAAERFDAAAVYRDIDLLMDWSRQALGPKDTAPRRPARMKAAAGADVSAGAAALEAGDTATAMDHFLRALASNPADLAASEALIALALAQGWREDAAQLLKQAALAAPLDPELARIEAMLSEDDSEYRSMVPQSPVLSMPFNAMKRLPELLEGDAPAGMGWGLTEEWGAWSDGPYTRLALSHDASETPLELRLNAMAVVSASEPPQTVTVFVDGLMAGQASIPRDGGGHDFPPALLAARPAGEIVVEMLVGSPGRARDENGVTVDRRQLGIGLLGIGLFQPGAGE